MERHSHFFFCVCDSSCSYSYLTIASHYTVYGHQMGTMVEKISTCTDVLVITCYMYLECKTHMPHPFADTLPLVRNVVYVLLRSLNYK